jgi:hypothetical protein
LRVAGRTRSSSSTANSSEGLPRGGLSKVGSILVPLRLATRRNPFADRPPLQG